MGKKLVSHARAQTRWEEIANSVSHGVGFLAALAASPVLIFSAVQHGISAGIVWGIIIVVKPLVFRLKIRPLFNALLSGLFLALKQGKNYEQF